MDYWKRKLLRQQLDRKMAPLKNLAESGMPDIGWIKSIRTSLGMTILDLALRVGIDQSRISRLENAEKKGNVKFSSMQKIATALDMEFVYGFVPRRSLDNAVYEQAVKYASDTLDNEHAGLTKKEREIAMKDFIQKTLIEEPKHFWRKR